MKQLLTMLALISALGWQLPVRAAASDAQLAAIAEMGRLNGIALHGGYPEQVQRIKKVLVLNLPKERALGDWFEQKTNASFMDFMSRQANCPGLLEFDRELDRAEKQLESAFKQ